MLDLSSAEQKRKHRHSKTPHKSITKASPHTHPPPPNLRFPSLKIIGGGVSAKTATSGITTHYRLLSRNFHKKLASQALIAIADIEEDKVHVGLSQKTSTTNHSLKKTPSHNSISSVRQQVAKSLTELQFPSNSKTPHKSPPKPTQNPAPTLEFLRDRNLPSLPTNTATFGDPKNKPRWFRTHQLAGGDLRAMLTDLPRNQL